MQEFIEGDLVEAVKGERVVRDRITKPSNPFFAAGLYLGTPSVIGLSSVASYINAGYTLKTIAKAMPPLPTEPGTVIAIGGWELVKLRLYNAEQPGGWELLPPKNERVRRSMDGAGVAAQCVYSDEWVRAEVEQDRDGFRIISEPAPVTAKRVLDRLANFWEFGPPRWMQAEIENIATEFGVTE